LRRDIITWLKCASERLYTPDFDKRNPSLWVFGCWEGQKYDDNSKYLFEYVNENLQSIDAVWITRNASVKEAVSKLGYKVYMGDESAGKEILRSAGFAFYTNGLDDFSERPLVCGSVLVALWHGVGIKNIYELERHSGRILNRLRKWKRERFDWVYRDVTVSQSYASDDYFISAFNLSTGNIMRAGQPRYDAFKVFHDCKEKYILYMPTYRQYNSKVIENTINEIASNELFNIWLKNNDLKFIIKLHYLTELAIDTKSERIEILRGDTAISSQELLANAACLITDYSSCAIDYSILDRPIYLYAPDYDTYCKEIGIIPIWENLYSIKAIIRGETLCNILIESNNFDSDWNVLDWIREKYIVFNIDSQKSFSENVIYGLVQRYPHQLEYLCYYKI